ncbi:MAG: ABC transporter ATP-binding protein [Candidatus Limiplasma sp.]|nr:ABC transporter ATP-binding protein [Clostridiales bacterium]MDY3243300.1 ABC transporter ATP-binding protein [Candidatus Limiplasma sp.]
MDQIVLSHVTKTFTTKTLGTVTAVNDFNLTIKEGECFSFLGPSGCGKTTTLRMIAGFEDLSQGEIHLCGKPVSIKSKNLYVPPEDRGLGMVFQSFAVWPHMNIFENVAFPLRVRKVPKAEMAERVKMALKHTSLDGMEKVYPGNLSGGQQQRIALARAIVTNPKVMLLDEPLSNLDPKLRETMRFEIKELQKKFNFTIIFVTHDQSEAMALSDRMMVMDMGNIVQIGTPTELYNRPVNRFVHKFLGQSTFTDVILQDGKAYARGDMEQPLPVALPENGEREMVMATRPNQIDMNRTEGYKTKVEKRIFLTNYTEYLVRVGDQLLQVQTPHRNAFAQGETCYLKFPGIMWYGKEDEAAEAERNRRQLV